VFPLRIKPERADKWRGRTLTTASLPRNEAAQKTAILTPKKVKKEPSVNTVDEICTSDAEVLSEGPQICPAVASVPGDDDKEVKFVSATRKIALTDFAHARACCLIHPFHVDPVKHCENCFCYVCNKPVADCTEWQEHCRAMHEITKNPIPHRSSSNSQYNFFLSTTS
jgi:hypothetical protein